VLRPSRRVRAVSGKPPPGGPAAAAAFIARSCAHCFLAVSAAAARAVCESRVYQRQRQLAARHATSRFST
jgi:hypothetical protein